MANRRCCGTGMEASWATPGSGRCSNGATVLDAGRGMFTPGPTTASVPEDGLLVDAQSPRSSPLEIQFDEDSGYQRNRGIHPPWRIAQVIPLNFRW